MISCNLRYNNFYTCTKTLYFFNFSSGERLISTSPSSFNTSFRLMVFDKRLSNQPPSPLSICFVRSDYLAIHCHQHCYHIATIGTNSTFPMSLKNRHLHLQQIGSDFETRWRAPWRSSLARTTRLIPCTNRDTIHCIQWLTHLRSISLGPDDDSVS